MPLTPEKQRILGHEGNTLVMANPGTGKTLLLAHKYASLIRKGIPQEQILCLTFTDKARREIEARIVKVMKEEGLALDVSKLQVYTFHSYALENIEEHEILSTNLLRYAIFQFIKEHEILNYSDEYLLSDIVPKMENLLRYLKSFGILPEQIELEEVRKHLQEGKNYSKEEIDAFAGHFVAIYQHYEALKNARGVDYADLLLKFLQLREIGKKEYVLVDELQDVNVLEADIALRSGKKFFVVGDAKQAIFGFQGGSIINFGRFRDSEQEVLTENFRSSNEILAYAKEYFSSRTGVETHRGELEYLHNAENKSGKKPMVYEVERNKLYAAACELAKQFPGKTAIIARQNYQIMELGKELASRGMEFSSTFFSASKEAKEHIIAFLRGVLGQEVQDLRKAMFTPFFPGTLQEAFEISPERLTAEEFLQKMPRLARLRESVKTVEDVNTLFREVIVPVCISYGRGYLSAALSVQRSYQEALAVIEAQSLEALTAYLRSADLLPEDSGVEKELVVTTVHKAKGKEFDTVIYLPGRPRGRSNFQDAVVEGILHSKGIEPAEELEEESLRVDFVAFTRAMKTLMILTDKPQEYLNEHAESGSIEAEAGASELMEQKHRAFALFVQGHVEEAQKLLENKQEWIREYVSEHFRGLERISFSSLPESAYKYFVENILGLRERSFTLALGTEVHQSAECLLAGKEYSVSEKAVPLVENLKKLLESIDYDEVETEVKLAVPLSSLGFASELLLVAKIDAVFRSGEQYLLVDWKTDRNTDYGAKHRQQLELYRRVFSLSRGVALEQIKVAIGYVGLRGSINTGVVSCELDGREPARSAFWTVGGRVERLLSWVCDVERFFEDFAAEEEGGVLWRSVVEEIKGKRYLN